MSTVVDFQPRDNSDRHLRWDRYGNRSRGLWD